MSESGKVKRLILSQLERGACCRIHLHRECCYVFGFKEPMLDRSEDKRFDDPFNELVHDKMIQEVRRVGKYRFLEITKKGRRMLSNVT